MQITNDDILDLALGVTWDRPFRHHRNECGSGQEDEDFQCTENDLTLQFFNFGNHS
jgi:hypothetical protein